MSATRRTLAAAAISMIAAGFCGCSSLAERSGEGGTLLDSMPWAEKKDAPPEPYPNPVKLAATWTPDVLTQMGRTPTRGFGGRLYFYDEKSRPVPVEGSLVVHGFDEKATDKKEAVKRFKFTPEQFTGHFSQSDIGASYSIWIPWDAVGGQQREISLVASFETTEGKLVQGTPAKVLLPGRKPSPETKFARKMSPQFRRWKQASSGATPPSSGLTTTTIPRRQPAAAEAPADWSPGMGSGRTELAGGTRTPSAELDSWRQPQQAASQQPEPSRVVPASARLPVDE